DRSDAEKVREILREGGEDAAERIQEILDPRCLYGVHINPEMRVKAAPGPAPAELDEQGWRVFLVKVHNEAGSTAALRASSPNARRLHDSPADEVRDRWLDLEMFNAQPMTPSLSGLNLEYRL